MRVSEVVRANRRIDAGLEAGRLPDPLPEPLPRHVTIRVPRPGLARLVEAGRSALCAVLREGAPAVHASALAGGVGTPCPVPVGTTALVGLRHAQRFDR